ncbi:acyl-CoA dehydrogenase family protein [Actinoplanes sp. NPDC051475]|uniref:acyl-CoA dehydrogenase family protein n=1 Tax=Actinoplanes sp. NPDC051475 TaxID=3157225 RepID=UPI0034510079
MTGLELDEPMADPARLAAELDEWLGDPTDVGNAFSWKASAVWDRAEAFPGPAVSELDVWGLSRHYVPARHGGALRRLDTLLSLLRTVARRDLTVAVAHAKTFLGSVCVWAAGSDDQCAKLAARIVNGEPVAWALTERDHGSDLGADEFEAVPDAEGNLRLSGEKWPINNASRADLVVVLARTAGRPGARALSLVLLDKEQAGPGTVQNLRKALTHGIRGADISGIVCIDARVPADALVGRPGTGLETVLRVLPLTRTVCTALSLGAADHALELATGFAEERKLYGRRVIELGRPAQLLAESYATLFAVEAVTWVVGRAAQSLTAEMPVLSAVAKAFVPNAVDDLIAACAEVLGARGFLDETYEDGRFAKLDRDHRIVSIFDGNTYVNRNALIQHFPVLARRWQERRFDTAGLAATVDPAVRMPDLDFTALCLFSEMGCSPVQSLESMLPRVLSRLASLPCGSTIRALVGHFCDGLEVLHSEMATVRGTAGRDVPAEAFDLAERYEWAFAAAAAVHLWLAVDDEDPAHSALARDGLWLEAVLRIALPRLCPALVLAEQETELLRVVRTLRGAGMRPSLYGLLVPAAARRDGTR